MAPGTHYCTSPITSIVRRRLNESSEEGHGSAVGWGLHGDQRQKGITFYFPPGDNRGVIHERDSSNNGARGGVERFLRSHVVQVTAALADEPGRAVG